MAFNFSLTSVSNFTVDGATGGGTLTSSGGVLSGSSTTARNISLRNIAFTNELRIDGPINSNIMLDHASWTNVGCTTSPTGARLHLNYSASGGPSGVTVQNSLFMGGSADGIQFGTAMTIIDNAFKNIYEGADTQCHTDAIQGVGPTGGETVIKGNWIINCADGIAFWDGPSSADIENNVIDSTTENNEIDLDSDTGSTILHNTLVNPGNSVGIDLTSKSGSPASKDTGIANNIIKASDPLNLSRAEAATAAPPYRPTPTTCSHPGSLSSLQISVEARHS